MPRIEIINGLTQLKLSVNSVECPECGRNGYPVGVSIFEQMLEFRCPEGHDFLFGYILLRELRHLLKDFLVSTNKIKEKISHLEDKLPAEMLCRRK